ncbi:unnamed protein product [Boreogadus saida]
MDRRLRLETRDLQHRTRGVDLRLRLRLRLRLETRDLQHRTRGPCLVEELLEGLPGLCLRRAAGGAETLEDDEESTNKDSSPGLWLRRADGGAKTLEDDITLPTRILFI